MINKIIAAFRPKPTVLRERFLQRYAGRAIIVHTGVSIGWVSELIKEAGCGQLFRIDARNQPSRRPTPIEWVVHQHLLKHHLPTPFIVKVIDETLWIRHLVRNNMPVHPSEIHWMLSEFPDNYHLKLTVAGAGFTVERGMSINDNAINLNATWGGTETEFI
ncbi:MAG: hypothetical protein HOP20_01340 [Sulfuriferula sp.]|nr:hypothetical protein [Sulfuriferula sp.]